MTFEEFIERRRVLLVQIRAERFAGVYVAIRHLVKHDRNMIPAQRLRAVVIKLRAKNKKRFFK